MDSTKHIHLLSILDKKAFESRAVNLTSSVQGGFTFTYKARKCSLVQECTLCKFWHSMTALYWWTVIVAQLVERSLPIQEVRSSNPVIRKNLFIY